jgi:hypothetical protein
MLQKSWGLAEATAVTPYPPYNPVYIYIYILHFVYQLSSLFLRYWDQSMSIGVGENTVNMVKVAMEHPALAHFTHVDVK